MPARQQGREGYWKHSFDADAERRHVTRRPAAEGGRPCARGDWCLDRTIDTSGPQRVIVPAPARQAFCLRDRAEISLDLRELPGLYLRIHAELGKTGGGAGSVVTAPFGPQLPIRLDADAVLRLTVATLGSWEARVRRAAGLTPPDPAADRATAAAVRDTCRTLRDWLDVLFARPPGWMTRSFPLSPGRHGEPAAIDDDTLRLLGDSEIVRIGVDYLTVMQQLDGACAGLEIIHLRYLARSVLGETGTRPEELLGVACYNCGHRLLRRADPPHRDGDPLYYSQCKGCRHRMTEPEYREHAQRLAAQHGGRKVTPKLAAS